ncbi:hypothetical protein CC1G_09515 [Coprinopsis cinerea okayama7|uniref:Uncharacterized protein n=1 Tax=Coprinopsis cinerea (strain Okayama-7 / 130 / ATCC MYA-4618 / FGSC 9003) TaxID=240176 RepID=A8P0U0_COPC7|nr:hypothetical protein CC1G_09515 [Coprinopsis cinerea okayama7\|eukprot:XP_001837964.1 hypothetical protein CC1G_09515 [Coprinopsis cinerea okayama7\
MPSSASSPTPSARQRTQSPFRSSSPSSLAPEDEIDVFMNAPSESDDDDMANNHQDDSSFTPGGSGGVQDAQDDTGRSQLATTLVQQQRADVVRARREATRLKLHPYQSRILEDFARAPPSTRAVTLFAEVLAIGNRVDDIVTSNGPYTISPGLQNNIKAYCTAVLLSPELSTYKGKVPRNRVMAIIHHYKLEIPANIDHDKQITQTIYQAITDELTQIRSKIKKAIAASIKPTKGAKTQSVYELAIELVKDTQCEVTVRLAARVALLRRVYSEDATESYWDSVNQRLELVLTKAGGDATKVHRALAGYLESDRKKYGVNGSRSAGSEHGQTEWQKTVDGIVEAREDSDD